MEKARMHRKEEVEHKVLELLKEVMDPEIGLNIVDLGLVYEIEYDEEKSVRVEMTLTSEACPMGDVIMEDIQNRFDQAFSELELNLQIVFDPPWDTDMVSEDGMRELGWERQ